MSFSTLMSSLSSLNFLGSPLPDLSRRSHLRALGGLQHDIAAGDVGRDVGVAQFFEARLKRRHRELVLAAHIDAAQEDDIARHERRAPFAGRAPRRGP